MDKRLLAVLLILSVLCPVLAQAPGNLPDPFEQGGVATMPTEYVGAFGAVTGTAATEFLPLWDFWLEFTIKFWDALKDYTEALIGHEINFDEYLGYKIFGVTQENFETYCGVIRNAPTQEDPWNMEVQGVEWGYFIGVIVAILVLVGVIQFSYGKFGAKSIGTFAAISGGIIAFFLFLTLGIPSAPLLALDILTIVLFFFATYGLIVGGEEEGGKKGAYFIAIVPLAILLIFAVSHLVSFLSPIAGTAWGTPGQIQIAGFVGMFIAGAIAAIIGTIGFVMDLGHIGKTNVVGKLMRSFKKLKKSAASKDEFHKFVEKGYGLQLTDKEGKTTEVGNVVGEYYKGTAGSEKTLFKLLGGKKKSVLIAGHAGIVPILFIVVGIVLMFVGLAPLGFRLPAMNVVAVYYLAGLLIFVISLTTIPQADPSTFFDNSETRDLILQTAHILNYDESVMGIVQKLGRFGGTKKFEEDSAKILKEFQGKTLDLVEKGKIGRELYPILTEGYERLVTSPFHQIIKVKNMFIWSIVILAFCFSIGTGLNIMLNGLSGFGYTAMAAGLVNLDVMNCIALNANIFTLLLWGSLIVSLVVFIIRRSSFALTLLLPDSVYVVINTIFGKKQIFSVVVKLFIAVIVAVMALESMNVYNVQSVFFYLHPFFAMAILAAVTFISTMFYVFEIFTLTTLGGFIHSFFSLMGNGLKKIFGAMQAGRIGTLLGGVFLVLGLMILIPFYLVPELLLFPQIVSWVAGGIFIIIAIPSSLRRSNLAFIAARPMALIYGIAAVICLWGGSISPHIAGWTCIQFAIGLILYGGRQTT
jgi:hypothetical protein